MAGVPVALLARSARCDLLASSGRPAELRTEAAALLGDLQRGTRPLSRAVYEANAADLRGWIGSDVSPVASVVPEALATAVGNLWDRWQQRSVDKLPSSGRDLDVIGTTPIAVVWTEQQDQLIALGAGPTYVERWRSVVCRAGHGVRSRTRGVPQQCPEIR